MGILNKIIIILVLVAVIAGIFYMMGDSEETNNENPSNVNPSQENAQTGEQLIQNDIVADEDDVDLGEVTS
ncbi:MAG: hypothetical protein Q7S27_02750 [Nanoarchaeota archaeon]|nr:hypothetical protein [Nanoarchaeota archaeon]